MKPLLNALMVAVAGGSLLSGCVLGTEISTDPCLVTGPDFAAKYTLKSQTGTAGTCGKLGGEMTGATFYPVLDAKGQQSGLKLGIEPEAVVFTDGYPAFNPPEPSPDLVPAEDTEAYMDNVRSLGSFFANGVGVATFDAHVAGDDGVCRTDAPSAISFDVPTTYEAPIPTSGGYKLTDGGVGPLKVTNKKGELVNNPDLEFAPYGTDAVAVKYEYGPVQVYSTPAAPGTMFATSVTYSQTIGGESCSSTFDVVAIHPAVGCTARGVGGPGADGVYEDEELDPSSCEPEADIAAGRLYPSGINPDFNTCCSKRSGLCVLKGNEIGAAAMNRFSAENMVDGKPRPIGICD